MSSERWYLHLLASLAIVILGALVLVWALDLSHIGRPAAVLTAESSAVELVIADRPAALEWLPVRTLFALDVASITDTATGQRIENADGDAQFAGLDRAVESLTPESMALPAGTRLAIQSREVPGEWDV